MITRLRTHDQRGFSLIETIAALGIFAIVTLGIVPLIASSLKGSALSRTETVAQNGARTVMEDIQGIKWWTSYDAKAKKVDLLDLYYPSTTSNANMGQAYLTGQTSPPLTGSGSMFVTTCAPAPSTPNPACPQNFPAGYGLKIYATFVKANAGTTPQTYTFVNPPSSPAYAWNVSGADSPPASLMNVKVEVTWTVHGKAHKFALESVLGDRHFAAPPAAVGATPTSSPLAPGANKVKGSANLDYVIRINTGYSSSAAQATRGCPAAPCDSDFTATMLSSSSTIQTQDTSTADATVTGSDIHIVRTYPTPQAPPASPPPDLATGAGITQAAHAPPTTNVTLACLPAPPTCTGQNAMTHPDLAATTFMYTGTKASGVSASVANELPTASATVNSTNVCGTPEFYFITPQLDSTNTASSWLRLDPSGTSGPYVVRDDSGSATPCNNTKGTTSATTTALIPTSTRAVETKATAHIPQINAIKLNAGWSGNNLFNMSAFDATVDCKSTPTGTPVATASWTATMNFAYDYVNNGANSYLSGKVLNVIQITANSAGNDTVQYRNSSNVLTTVTVPNAIDWMKQQDFIVYDSSSATDIYMFDTPAHRGYFTNIVENKTLPTSVSADGRITSASIDTALRLDTNKLTNSLAAPALNDETAVSLSIGNLSCEAEDNR